ncbi:MAG: hypothetical protein R3B13_21870 [Polyangiaceae bacterium]
MNRFDALVKELFDELEELVKRPESGADLSERGVNSSLVLLAVQGLRAYLNGDAKTAADDLGTVADEISARHSERTRRERGIS